MFHLLDGAAELCRLCECAHGHNVEIRTLHRQHVSRHRTTVGHEFLDSADRYDGRWLDLYIHCGQDKGLQADASAEPVDERLRTVCHHACRLPCIRPGQPRELVLPQGRDRHSVLLQRVSCRPRHICRADPYRKGCRIQDHIFRTWQGISGHRCLRQRIVCQGHP